MFAANVMSSGPSTVVGQQEYTAPGTYSWTCPAGVTSVSVVAIGGGGTRTADPGYGSRGGSGGGLGYINNYTVAPGNSYTVVVGSGGLYSAHNSSSAGNDSYFINTSTVAGKGGTSPTGGTYTGTGGGNGGNGGFAGDSTPSGGGGAGGYAGNGGAGGNSATYMAADSTAGTSVSGGGGGGGGGGGTYSGGGSGGGCGGGGGGTGIYGQGASGTGGARDVGGGGGAGLGGSSGGNGAAGSAGSVIGGTYGGGGVNGDGRGGAVRIIWPGLTRQFPSTRTANE